MTDVQREQAIRRIRAVRGFWWHVAAFVIVNAGLLIIWALTWTGYFWPGWVLLGWGIGLAFHAVAVFAGYRPITEERIQKEIDRST